jgi:glycosyltransferase involved in cell wall biosynthesis
MKISIITPTYNYGRFLEANLRSVEAQQGDFEIEHIIFDCMSTDFTESIVNHRGRIKGLTLVYRREIDSGQTNAINKGFAIASGDIVAWLNADERLLPGALEIVRNAFLQNPGIDIIFGNSNYIGVDGNIIEIKREFGFSFRMLIEYGCYIPSCATFFRRSVFLKGGVLDEQMRVCMDYEWYVRLYVSGLKFLHIDETIAEFVWHESNISMKFRERSDIEHRYVVSTYVDNPIYRSMLILCPFIFRLKWRIYRNVTRLLRFARRRVLPDISIS